ncbi:MAG: YHS domain-containing protein [Nitrospiraceae bacterium]
MWRLLIVIVLLIVLYFLLRSALRELRGQPSQLLDKDQMIQDPVCRTYVPKASAISARIGGQTYYFCSSGCAEIFQKRLSQPG